MSEARWFLGVDGGGSKTAFALIDADGVEVARTATATTYHVEIGLAEAERRLAQGIDALLNRTGVAREAIANGFFGLPAFGEDAAADARLTESVGRLLGHSRFRCGNDMICGWAGSLGCADGINIVAGTGSIGYGEHGGLAARCGGWGEVFGDEGSAYWIAVQGLALFTRMSDGRTPPGPLHGLVREAMALGDDLDLLTRLMAPDVGRTAIAALAPLVSAAADAGDGAAGRIIDAAADALFEIAETLARRLAFAEVVVPISWSGGVLANVTRLRARFVQQLEASGRFRPTAPLFDPPYGAALYARHLHR